MNGNPIPAELLAAVKRDLRPVRPLASPLRRAVALAPLALALLFAAPLVLGWRGNLPQLAPWASWGLSALEALAGLAILAVAFRQAVPGREFPRGGIMALIGVAWVAFAALVTVTERLLPATPPPGIQTQYAWECFGDAILFAIPALAIPSWLVARALPGRPALTGSLCGLAVGVMGDAGMRLFCWITDIRHVMLAHGGAIVFAMLAGALTAVIVDRRRWRTRGST